MNNTVMYKGYVGSVDFSADDQLLFGKVQGIRSLISYEGKSVGELIEDFHEAVDEREYTFEFTMIDVDNQPVKVT